MSPNPVDRTEELLPELSSALSAAIADGTTVPTLAQGRPNRIVSIGSEGVRVETTRSLARSGGNELVPAWMLNIAWRRLQSHHTLKNTDLLQQLGVKRSSAVCALLAQIPGVQVVARQPITLALRP